jgi:hypothetical protein
MSITHVAGRTACLHNMLQSSCLHSSGGMDGYTSEAHCAMQYLLDPSGKFVTFYGKSFTAEQIAASLVDHARAWKQQHPEYKLKVAQ